MRDFRVPETRSLLLVALPLLTLLAGSLAGCSDASAPVLPAVAVEGHYQAAWIVRASNTTRGLADTAVCPGTVTLVNDDGGPGTFHGSYAIFGAGDCAGDAPVTGDIRDGRLRRDGGVDFHMEAPGDSTIFQNLFPSDAIQGVFAGACSITEADTRMVGAVIGNTLEGGMDAAIECGTEQVPEAVVLELQVSAAR